MDICRMMNRIWNSTNRLNIEKIWVDIGKWEFCTNRKQRVRLEAFIDNVYSDASA